MLVEARHAAGLTQRALAELIGRPYTIIANIERGERRIDVVEFIALARAMGLDETALLDRIGRAIGEDVEL